MGSSAKKRTTMAKLQRGNKLRERRADKQARKRAVAEPALRPDVRHEAPLLQGQ